MSSGWGDATHSKGERGDFYLSCNCDPGLGWGEATLLSRGHPYCPSKGQKVKKGKAQATVRSEGCGSDFIPPTFSLGHLWIDSCGSCPWPHCPRVGSAQPWNFWVWRPPRVCVKCGDPEWRLWVGGGGVLYTSANPQSGQGRTRASLTF